MLMRMLLGNVKADILSLQSFRNIVSIVTFNSLNSSTSCRWVKLKWFVLPQHIQIGVSSNCIQELGKEREINEVEIKSKYRVEKKVTHW